VVAWHAWDPSSEAAAAPRVTSVVNPGWGCEQRSLDDDVAMSALKSVEFLSGSTKFDVLSDTWALLALGMSLLVSGVEIIVKENCWFEMRKGLLIEKKN